MEKRLKEAGLSTEQSGQHELIREIQRIQVWIQSLNGGWSSMDESNSNFGEEVYTTSGTCFLLHNRILLQFPNRWQWQLSRRFH